MKKIKHASVDQRDRIICETVNDAHNFYYQSFKTKEQIFLFTITKFSISIFAYFHDNGKFHRDRTFSLSIREFYADKSKYHNRKLGHLADRIPGMIDYVLRERDEEYQYLEYNKKAVSYNDLADRELTA